MISFFKENLLNKIIKQNDLISFEIYGKKENFRVLSINLPYDHSIPLQSDSSLSYLITEKSIIIIIKTYKL